MKIQQPEKVHILNLVIFSPINRKCAKFPPLVQYTGCKLKITLNLGFVKLVLIFLFFKFIMEKSKIKYKLCVKLSINLNKIWANELIECLFCSAYR